MSIIFNSADIAETMNNGVSNVTGADSIITENYTNVVQHGIKIDMSVKEKTISGTPPLSFNSNGTPLIDYTIYGNAVQDGTPTPDSPVDVIGAGNYVSGNYVVPITTNTTTTINLNSVPTTRKIKKLVLDGTEGWKKRTYNGAIHTFELNLDFRIIRGLCSHYAGYLSENIDNVDGIYLNNTLIIIITDLRFTTPADFKSFLAQQYANGTPVTVWYVLATEETGIVNEPLMKIGDYADSVSYSQSGVTIPTAVGNNTIDVQTTLKPSNISITYKGR